MAQIAGLFVESLEKAPHTFLTPDLPLHTDVLAYLKHTLDPIAAQISASQQARLQELRRKRKRGQNAPEGAVLRLKQVHTQDFAIEQIWEQARRIIAATKQEADLSLAEIEAEEAIENSESESEVGEEGVDYVVEGEDVTEDDDDEVNAVEDEDLDDDGEITNEALGDDPELDSDASEDAQPAEEFVADKFGLNDGFFSIDDFNRQSEFLEQRDVQGADDGAASDEEDVDWDADPLAGTITIDAAGEPVRLEDSDDDEEEEDGAAFGNVDDASDDDMSIDGDDMGVGLNMGNTNQVMYSDFFAPPAQKASKKKKGRPNPHNFPVKTAGDEDVQRTIDAVQRDLFEESEDEGADLDEEETPLTGPQSRKSAHERRQAAVAEEIRKLEAANVAKRQWTMSGEARAVDRPVNSLLEEDFEFERTGKPVPVITAEVSESIEELIKRRILAYDFQDIPRRRPNDLATGKDGRRGQMDFELDNSKSKKSLAEEYEEEHLRKTDPNYVDVKDEKMAAEQKEIEALWKDVSSKLDGLSSWNFRPKQSAPTLDIKVDAPTITMEDARPNAGGEIAAASQLAPQEIYKAGAGSKGVNEEVVGKSGLPALREELSREEKQQRRRREKERIRKASGNEPTKTESKASKEKKDVVSNLKKGGVKVIGKKGELTDVAGNAANGQTNGVSASRLKL